MTLSQKHFEEMNELFPVNRAFFTVRAVQRRAHFRRVYLNLLEMLGPEQSYEQMSRAEAKLQKQKRREYVE